MDTKRKLRKKSAKNNQNLPWSKYKVTKEISIRWRDLDSYNHVTNSVYFNYFEEARVHLFKQLELFREALLNRESDYGSTLVKTSVEYKKQALLGDPLIVGVRISEIKKIFIETEYKVYNKDTKDLIAKGFATNVLIDRKKFKIVSVPKEIVEQLLKYS